MTTTRLSRFLGFLAVGLSLHLHAAKATTVGLTPYTPGSYGVWDNFPGTNFTGKASDSGAAFTSPALSVTSGGILIGAANVDNRLYLNGAASTWTITGSTGYAIKGFQLQLKNYSYTTQSIASFFTATVLTINGVNYSPNSAVSTVVPEGSVNDEIYTWTWTTALAANAATGNFTLSFPGSGGMISIDGLAVNASPTTAVPEPSTVAAAALGGLAVLGAVRRRRAGASA